MPHELDPFLQTLRNRIDDSADEFEPSEASRKMAFIEHVMALMADGLSISFDQPMCFEKPLHVLHGYGEDSDSAIRYLVAGDFQDAETVQVVLKKEVDEIRRRLLRFAKDSLKGFHDELAPGAERDVAQRLHTDQAEVVEIRLVLLFDRLAKAYDFEPGKFRGVNITTQVWDLEAIETKLGPERTADPIDIDLDAMGCSLPVLEGGEMEGVYRTYLAAMPGQALAEIYRHYTSRLLERNVRAFLQLRGNVNKGIRNTIVNEPEMFLTYNNGLSATASALKTEVRAGQLVVVGVKDLQIVNGGQTTATLHRVMIKEKGDLSKVRVPLKLTEVLDVEKMDELVPNISRNSNAQNGVQEADFRANDPFHRSLERWSRAIKVPSESKVATFWFYERARGQYEVTKGHAASTKASRSAFLAKYPAKKRFDKLAVAKAINAWDFQVAHEVSLGGQKNFDRLTRRIMTGKLPPEPDANYYRQLICKIIVFRAIDELVRQRMEPGYKANIVAYTMSWFSQAVKGRLPYSQIWADQAVPPLLLDQLHLMAVQVREHLVNPQGTSNVTEWAKKPECWDLLQDQPIPSTEAFGQGYEALLDLHENLPAIHIDAAVQSGASASEALEVPLETWVALQRWRGLPRRAKLPLSLVIRALSKGKPPRPELHHVAMKHLSAARGTGFKG